APCRAHPWKPMGGARPSAARRRVLRRWATHMRPPTAQASPDHTTYQARLPTRSCASTRLCMRLR
ncbi:hypothetical protein UB46_41290, partial [Burkholderiaceae bacterium 16]